MKLPRSINRRLLIALSVLGLAMGWLTVAAQRPESDPAGPPTPGRVFSGRVIDGLGRPIPAASITLLTRGKDQKEPRKTALRSGEDGRFSVVIQPGAEDAVLSLEKEGYGSFDTIAPSGRKFVLSREIDWGELAILPGLQGEEADRGLREALASDGWGQAEGKILGILFESQDELRPSMRRLIGDAHVGDAARDWLDLLDDLDGLPGVRRYAPKEEVLEVDLVEAIRATARLRNTYSSAPEPQLAIDSITFTKELDRALVVCGINRVAMTGITWQFVFRKVGQRWELRSAKEAGRS